MAFSGMECDFSVSEMFPTLRVAQMFPTVLRVEHRALAAQRTHGAVALNIFHGDFPTLAHELIPLLTSGHCDLFRTNWNVGQRTQGRTCTKACTKDCVF